jgi:hypothetical protein
VTKHPKRPRDPNQLGKLIVDLATGERTEDKPAPPTPAQEFARSGGKLVSYHLTLDAFCKKSVAIEMPQCHSAYAVMA